MQKQKHFNEQRNWSSTKLLYIRVKGKATTNKILVRVTYACSIFVPMNRIPYTIQYHIGVAFTLSLTYWIKSACVFMFHSCGRSGQTDVPQTRTDAFEPEQRHLYKISDERMNAITHLNEINASKNNRSRQTPSKMTMKSSGIWWARPLCLTSVIMPFNAAIKTHHKRAPVSFASHMNVGSRAALASSKSTHFDFQPRNWTLFHA